MKSTSRRKLAVRLLLAAVALALTHGLIRLAPDRFEVWNARIGDQLHLLEADTGFERFAVPPQVVHIDANFYYTRSVHAEVIRTLAAAGVQTQIIDSTFTGRVGDAEDLPLIEAVSEAPAVLLGISFGRFGHQLQLQPVKDDLSAAESRLFGSMRFSSGIPDSGAGAVDIRFDGRWPLGDMAEKDCVASCFNCKKF